jgi:hypothetical protein
MIQIIVLKSGPAQRVDPGLGRPGAGTGPGWRKTGEEKTRYEPTTPLTRQDPVKNSVATR